MTFWPTRQQLIIEPELYKGFFGIDLESKGSSIQGSIL